VIIPATTGYVRELLIFRQRQSSCRELCKTCAKPGEPEAQELAEKLQVHGAELQSRRHRKGTEVSQETQPAVTRRLHEK
jgi:hypothetical protein